VLFVFFVVFNSVVFKSSGARYLATVRRCIRETERRQE